MKYKSFTLPNKTKSNPTVCGILFSMLYFKMCFFFRVKIHHTNTCKQIDSLPYFDVVSTVYMCVCVNNKNCIGCIQLYYTYVLKIARLKFNLSFKTNCLFLRRKLFSQFYVYSWKYEQNVNATRHDILHNILLYIHCLYAHCFKSWNFSFYRMVGVRFSFALLFCACKFVFVCQFRWVTLHAAIMHRM